MRRSLLVVAAALAAVTGTARADTFAVVPSTPSGLPSSAAPNGAGSLRLPAAWTARPAVTEHLAYPQLLALWRSAEAEYGVPWQVLAAVNKIESNFGRNMGPSSAGAIGWMQFIPSTWLRWGTDGDGDGFASPWDPDDAVYAAARYLAAAGGASDLRRALFAYNHADWYVNQVLGLARVYGGGDGAETFALDRLELRLGAARRTVARAGERLVAASVDARRLARLERRLLARARGVKLLSARLALERKAGLLDGRRVTELQRVAQARQALAHAQVTLRQATEQARPASFASGTRPLLGAPTYRGRWVFPVGGGPGVVSVGHTHHDYPAADIAAPSGSPAYALADGVVVAAWHDPDGRCGIGLTYRTSDGQEWTYCHLSYLQPQVSAGAGLGAGAQIGLVGATGHATGPHLHLQLDPATSYPQAQAWFEGFAGVAFRWQDAPTPERAVAAMPAGGPVFRLVADDAQVVRFTR